MDLILTGQAVRLRPVTADDVSRLQAILSEPSVARWWTPPSSDGAAADWLEPFGQVTFAIEHVGQVVGNIQFLEEGDEDYRSAGIDLFLSTDAQGNGLGPDAIRTVARYLIEERGHHRLTIDPAAANERAIRAYTRVGFKRVGVMRQYERGQDGTRHDRLLMDLLAGELT